MAFVLSLGGLYTVARARDRTDLFCISDSVTLSISISNELNLCPVLEYYYILLWGPWFPGAGVKDIWEDRVPGTQGLYRETHGVEMVGVLVACCILTLDS